MQITIRKAERVKSKLRLGIAGPSGSGKTMGALKLAKGIGGKVCLIDTERGSGDLYADLYDYDIISLEPPFKPEVLVEALHTAEVAGYEVIIIDSLSHFWADEGGLLDQADKLQSKTDRFRVWSELTPQHRRLVNGLLNSPRHIIATMRSKQAYEMEKDEKTGKSAVKKHGLAPVQREGMEYEFTIFFDVDHNHNASASKDRTNMFNDEVFRLDEDVGQRILNWLNTGKADIGGMKRDIMFQVRDRLEIALPAAEDLPAFFRTAIPKLTGQVWAEENLEAILEKLTTIEDKLWAQKVAWERPESAAPAPSPEPAQAPAAAPLPDPEQSVTPEEHV